MVQLRDEEHRPLPGIELGDVGSKLGDHGIDTGYIRMKNVRIPRVNMFTKRQHVTKVCVRAGECTGLETISCWCSFVSWWRGIRTGSWSNTSQRAAIKQIRPTTQRCSRLELE